METDDQILLALGRLEGKVDSLVSRQKVIDDAPIHAKQRLEGLLFQLNSRKLLNRKNLMLADSDNSSVTKAPLTLIQNMLKDLHAMQTESIYLSTRKYQKQLKPSSTAIIYSFKKTDLV